VTLPWTWLGRMDHAACVARQRLHRDGVIEGVLDDVLWLVEHPRTITEGRRPAPGTPSPEALRARGVAFSKTERGGLATYHGPGQLVAYPIVSLTRRRFTVRAYVNRLEQVVIDFLGDLGLTARRRSDAPGVYVGTDKIAAVGIHIRRGVTIHGLALNIDPNLDDFGLIVPCGLTDAGVTSVARLLGAAPEVEEIAADFGPRLATALEAH